jgi:hypothetical protein
MEGYYINRNFCALDGLWFLITKCTKATGVGDLVIIGRLTNNLLKLLLIRFYESLGKF